MQMKINHEIADAMQMMKYANNHPWKFKHPEIAFFAGFLQAFSTALTGFICYRVIVSSPTVIDLAKDFTALMIISDFDNQFAKFSKETIAKEAIKNTDGTYKDIFLIETTTSR